MHSWFWCIRQQLCFGSISEFAHERNCRISYSPSARVETDRGHFDQKTIGCVEKQLILGWKHADSNGFRWIGWTDQHAIALWHPAILSFNICCQQWIDELSDLRRVLSWQEPIRGDSSCVGAFSFRGHVGKTHRNAVSNVVWNARVPRIGPFAASKIGWYVDICTTRIGHVPRTQVDWSFIESNINLFKDA